MPIKILVSAGTSIPVTFFKRVMLREPKNKNWSLREEVGVQFLNAMMPNNLYFLRPLANFDAWMSSKFCGQYLEKFTETVEIWDDRLYDLKVFRNIYSDHLDIDIVSSCLTNNTFKVKLKGYWIGQKHENEVVILYAHGGGFVIGNSLMHVKGLSDLIRTLKKDHGVHARVFSLEYPLSPEYQYPVALNSIYAAFLYLTKVYDAKKVVVGGDSAGGNLSLTCMLRLRAHNHLIRLIEELRCSNNNKIFEYIPITVLNPPHVISCKPIGLVLLSPWVDVVSEHYGVTNKIYKKLGGLDYLKPTMSSNCSTYYTLGRQLPATIKRNQEALSLPSLPSISTTGNVTWSVTRDTKQQSRKINHPGKLSSPIASSNDIINSNDFPIQHPLVSPIYGHYSEWEYGPILFQAGGAEIMNKDHCAFIEHVHSYIKNGPVIIEDIEPEMIHAFSMMELFLGKKPKEALKRCAQFIAAIQS